MKSFDIAALGIGFVPEHRAIFRDLTVEENLKIAERKKATMPASKNLSSNFSLTSGGLSRFQAQSFRWPTANARHRPGARR